VSQYITHSCAQVTPRHARQTDRQTEREGGTEGASSTRLTHALRAHAQLPLPRSLPHLSLASTALLLFLAPSHVSVRVCAVLCAFLCLVQVSRICWTTPTRSRPPRESHTCCTSRTRRSTTERSRSRPTATETSHRYARPHTQTHGGRGGSGASTRREPAVELLTGDGGRTLCGRTHVCV